MADQPHVMILDAPFYPDISGQLVKGAVAALESAGASHEIFQVPGALEIPAAIAISVRSMDHYEARRRFDGYVALGCVIRGETTHYDHVANAVMGGLQEVTLRYCLALGTGVLTVDNRDQAMARAAVDQGDKGGSAALTCLRMIGFKAEFHMYPR